MFASLRIIAPMKICERCAGLGRLPTGEEMRLRREKAGVGLVNASLKMKIAPSYLCDLEAGRKLWNAELLRRWERAFK